MDRQVSSIVVLPFTISEAEPLLKTLSKIHRVTLVAESRYANEFSAYPRICFLGHGPFGTLNRAVFSFEEGTPVLPYGQAITFCGFGRKAGDYERVAQQIIRRACNELAKRDTINLSGKA